MERPMPSLTNTISPHPMTQVCLFLPHPASPPPSPWSLDETLFALNDRSPPGRLYVPPVHPQWTSATLRLVARCYWWSRWQKDVEEYVASCSVCPQLKASHQAPTGLLHPLPILTRPWSHLAMDFITDLPCSKGNIVILIVIDRFCKMCWLIALPKLPTAMNLADLLLT